MITTQTLLDFFKETRKHTETICTPLQTEDYVVQPIVDVSPPKWHLGHTTWFFEEFILKHHKPGYTIFSDDFAFVFNSYYESVGKRVVRTDRGNLSRPTVAQVYAYRKYVTEGLIELLEESKNDEILKLLTIGIHHEKQHQELLLTDIKYILGNNPLMPAYDGTFSENTIEKQSQEWISITEGIYEIGHQGNDFCYDNELGRHKVYLHDFEISNKLVTNGEFIEFINARGYQKTLLWHAEGWDWVQTQKIIAPLYWHLINDEWHQYTFKGLQKIDPEAPLAHISYYEAFAYAQWKEMRLPTEFEWEVAQSQFNWGQRWEWTESAYLPYPGYAKEPGALGEYNGKFMVNQKVLRGGSVATPTNHTRATYRNFFQTGLRWQFTGLRLVK
ncbi:ergothioneine biosynthesis protein EgtB [uncultured Dokdonia sp.]|uniref:ergothioneine biosynthesis protein EgtB n=1 Tax=uncultured Dokdonia sp. TaxID=575653 RepID=UPI002618FC3F|nr:ergothioneine biosynthesis protein EgtB [uncultured Dokdonia sp.]